MVKERRRGNYKKDGMQNVDEHTLFPLQNVDLHTFWGSKMSMEHIMQECFRFYMKERLMKIFQGLRVEIKNTKLILTIYIFMIGGN